MRPSWFRGIFSSGQAKPPATDPQEVINDVRRRIEVDVAAAFATKAEILESAMDIIEAESAPKALRAQAARMIDEALAAHARAQAEWPLVTDCDRLDRAFAALEADGVVTRQNFSCCGTCGSSEIWDEMEAAEQSARPVRGYAFYHMQDTENGVDGSGVYLNYGSSEDGPEASVAIGREIEAALNKQGLTTNWDGTIKHRIGVSLDWKRRRSGQ